MIMDLQWVMTLFLILPTILLTTLYVVLYIRSSKRFRAESLTDDLMSIKNRRYINTFFPEIVNEHYKNISPLSVIMVDVDHFKQYNDRYGHQEGDRALVEISAAISATVRKTDTVCRYGGEELLVILADSGPNTAELIAERIQAAVVDLAIKHDDGVKSGVVTVSQGIFSAVPGKIDSDKEFIMHADRKLYEAKKSGRNRYVIAEEDPLPVLL